MSQTKMPIKVKWAAQINYEDGGTIEGNGTMVSWKVQVLSQLTIATKLYD